VTTRELIDLTARSVYGRRVTARTVTFKPLAEEPLLSTVYDIEVCKVGIEYPLSSGPATFTPEDLLEAVASQDDPAVVAPRVWLGHPDDDRFHQGRATPAGSAEPAIGKLVNMRVEDDGMTLVADAVGVPTWLARILSSAYPSRSIEGYQEAETVTGHKWGLVITDLALLGVTWPGVSTLDDLQSLYSEDGPEGVEVEEEDMTVTAARAITAQVNVDDVRRSYYDSLESSQMWWWIRAIQLDPNELIVDDDEGGLYRVPFTIDGEEVTFGEAAKVKITYVNASQAKDPAARGLLVNYFTAGKTLAANYENRDESRPETNDQEVTMTPEQLALIGLPADATAEQITARLTELQNNGGGEGGEPPETGEPGEVADPSGNPSPPAVTPPASTPAPGGEPTPSPDQVPEPEAVAAALQARGLVAVPADAWAGVQAGAAAGARVAEQAERERRDRVVREAVTAGRIAPAQAQQYRTRFDQDPDGTNTLLTAAVEKGGLMPGLIPVEARGADPTADDMSTEAYPAGWLPELANRDAQTPVTLEG
jgi:Mu-like prophage I protein